MQQSTLAELNGGEERRPPAEGRRPYARPRLEVLGELRTLTLGGSPGVGDSGDPANFQPPA